MKKIIIITIAVLAITAITVLTINKTPQKDGENLIFRINDKEYNVSDYFALLKDYYDDNYIYQRFEKDLLTSLDRSDHIKEEAQAQVEQLNGSIAESKEPEVMRNGVVLTLKSLGYTGFDQVALYFENYLLRTEIVQKYVFENMDTYFELYQEANKPRLVSHILFKVSDVENVTSEELNSMNNIKTRIENGEDFALLAKEFSSDGSSQNGGALGLMDKNSNFVEPFLNAALELQSGQLSTWVKSEYGFHLIKVDTSNKETLIKEPGLVEMIQFGLPEVDAEAMKKLISETEITFQDDTIKEIIFNLLNTKGIQ